MKMNIKLEKFETLKSLQRQVIALEFERGHCEDTILQKSLLLGEEFGELCKAIREAERIQIHDDSERYSVEDELADCLFVLASLANRYGIDLQVALYHKVCKDELKTYNKGVN